MNPVNLSFVGLKNYIKVFNTPLMITLLIFAFNKKLIPMPCQKP